jgi:hypothetical protein
VIKISPVGSLDMQRRSLLSQTKSGGRKQLLGQAQLLALIIMFAAAVVLVLGSTGLPFLNSPQRYASPHAESIVGSFKLNLPTVLTLDSSLGVRIASLWKVPSILGGSHGSGEVDSEAWRRAIISFWRSTCSRRASNYEGKRLEQ